MARKATNPQNLKPFKKGPDPRRNMKGPTGNLPTLRAVMAEVFTVQDAKGRTDLQAILLKLKTKAKGGDLKAIEMVLDRIYGKPMQKQEVTGAEGSPLIPAMDGKALDARIKALQAKLNPKKKT